MQIKPSEKLTVVIPMYNEAGNVSTFTEEVTQTLLKQHTDFEIVVVDDGSSDNTYQELQRLKTENPCLRVLRHRANCGQSVAIISGVRAARNPWIVTLDGDGQNDPADIIKLIQAAEQNFRQGKLGLVAGNRVNRKDTGWKKFGSRFANKIRRGFLKDDCPDTGCGIKLFPRDIFLTLPHFNHLHRYLPALFQRAGCRVVNVPVNHRPRVQGSSKYGNWGRLKVGISDLVGVAWLIRRPCAPELEPESEPESQHQS